MGSLSISNSGDHRHPLQVVMLPSLGFDHIFPFIHLSNALAANAIKVTFLTLPSLVPRIRPALDPRNSILNYELPPIDGLPPNVESTNGSGQEMSDLQIQALDGTRAQIIAILRELSPHVIIFDFIQYWVPEVAESLGIKSVYFAVFTAITVASSILFGLSPPQKPVISRLRIPPRELLATFLSVKPYELRGMIPNMNDSSPSPSTFSRLVSSIARSNAIALKSAYEIERPFIKFFSSQCKKPVLPTFLLLPKAPTGEIEPKLAGWLSNFPNGSVVFCSFGSGSYLSGEQMKELVAGLEMSRSPFLAVLNTPVGMPEKEKQKLDAEIFGEKAEGRGIVHSCHAGYNSIMEAVESGCQLVLVPLKGDQYTNMKLMVVELKAAVKVKRSAWDGRFSRKDVCEAVRTVMLESKEGKTVRANNAKLREILLQQGLQENYTKSFITKLKELAGLP